MGRCFELKKTQEKQPVTVFCRSILEHLDFSCTSSCFEFLFSVPSDDIQVHAVWCGSSFFPHHFVAAQNS